jgi:hypothetical protein
LLLLTPPTPLHAQTLGYKDQDGNPIPLPRVYEFAFRYQGSMEKLATDWEKNGKPGAPVRDILRLRFQLSPIQFATFEKVALHFQAQAKDLDGRMGNIVVAERAAHPKTRAFSPDAKAQLRAMLAERDADASEAVRSLHQLLEPSAANALDRAVIIFYAESNNHTNENPPPQAQPAPQA